MRRTWGLFLEHLSFGSPRAITLNFVGILLTLALIPTDQLHWLPVRSIWEKVFHVTPYSSGMTRALSRLLHGDWTAALAFNRLSLLVLALILALLFKNAWVWHRSSHRSRQS